MSQPQLRLLVACLLLLQPLLWLWPCITGHRRFVPYDLAEYPPVALQLDAATHRALVADKNHDATEVPVWLLPEIELAGRELRAGRAPTWNPHARHGAPMLANSALGLLYPPTWILLASSDPERWLGVVAWLQLAIGGLLALGLFRAVELSWSAAWFGATLFQLSGPLAANAYWWMRLGSLIWLPGLLWALLRLAAAERTRTGPLAAVAACLALPWLAGFPPYAIASTLLAGLLALRLVAQRLGTDGARAARSLTVRLLTGLLLGACLAAPQILPALHFFPLSARTPDPPLELLAATAFESYGLLGYLLPDALSHPASVESLPYGQQPLTYLWSELFAADGRRLQPNYNYTEYTVYFGSFGLLLACFGAVRGRGHLRWWLLLVLSLVVGLALFLPGLRWLYLLPAVKNVFPMRWLVPATLLLAWLAAIGCERLQLVEARGLRRLALFALLLAAAVPWLASRPAARHAAAPDWPATAIAARYTNPAQGIEITPAAATAHLQAGAPAGVDRVQLAVDRLAAHGMAAGGWLLAFGLLLLAHAALPANSWIRRCAMPLALALAVLQLGLHGQPLLRGCERSQPWQTPVHEFLRQAAHDAAADGGFLFARGSRAEALPAQLPPGQLLQPGLRDLQFLTFYDGRSLQPLAAVLGSELAERHATKGFLTTSLPDRAALLSHPLLDLLGLRFLLATEPLQHAGQRVGPTFTGPRGEFFIYERAAPLPRALSVPELQLLADDAAVLAALADPGLQPRERAFATPAAATGVAPRRAGAAGQRQVRFAIDTPTHIELDVAAGTTPYLLLTDTWLPGWTASIDGVPVAIHRANHYQRLVELPDRACRVVFCYSVPGLGLGLWLAGAAAIAILLGGFAGRRSSQA